MVPAKTLQELGSLKRENSKRARQDRSVLGLYNDYWVEKHVNFTPPYHVNSTLMGHYTSGQIAQVIGWTEDLTQFGGKKISWGLGGS